MNAVPLWTADEVLAATGGTGARGWVAGGVSIDSRTIAPGDLFVALQGPNFDGHDFVGRALAGGAAAALVSRVPTGSGVTGPLVHVRDTLAGLTSLGQAGRARSDARIIALTGSTGKTSTKEALRTAFSALARTFASAASHNNHWGVPLSLARLPRDAAYGIFEMGMNHAGEIRELGRLVRPHVAVITNIGVAHLEFLGSREAIADAKSEIFAQMSQPAAAVLPRDDDFYSRLVLNANRAGMNHVVSFGRHASADVRLVKAELDASGSRVSVEVAGRRIEYRLSLPGEHQVYNSLAVLASVQALGGDPAIAADALVALRPIRGRGLIERLCLPDGGSITLLDESYNANPASVAAALGVLARQQPQRAGRRIAVLGDMRELGSAAAQMHAALAEDITAAGVERVFLCGPLMRHLAEVLPPSLLAGHAADSAALAPLVLSALQDGDVVLVKGSLASGMKRVVDLLSQPAHPLPRAANGE